MRRRRGSIDWASVRARLDAARAAPTDDRTILAERAARLARRPAAAPEDVLTEHLVSTLGDERLAIATTAVREVLRLGEIAPLPGTSALVLGVAAVRGNVVPVFDLGALLARNAPAEARRRLVLMGTDTDGFALAVDDVLDVARIGLARLAPPPVADDPVVRGVLPDALVVLSADALLTDARLRAGAHR